MPRRRVPVCARASLQARFPLRVGARACASTDRFPVRAANSQLCRGNENSTVRWAVPTPQMYSVGGLTCIYETRARVRAHTEETRARPYKPRRRLVAACRSASRHPSSSFPTLFIHAPALSKTAHSLSLSLFREPIQSSASYDLHVLVIPSV